MLSMTHRGKMKTSHSWPLLGIVLVNCRIRRGVFVVLGKIAVTQTHWYAGYSIHITNLRTGSL